MKIAEDQSFKVGPESVSRQLKSLSRSFGGPTLTLTDAAIAAGHLQVEAAKTDGIGLSFTQAKEIISSVCLQVHRRFCE